MGNARLSSLAALLFLLAPSGVARSAPAAGAEELTVQAQADKTKVAQGEKLVFSVVVSGSIRQSPEIELGSMEGFKVVSSDQAHQVEVKHGRMTQTFVLTRTLAAETPGTHVIGPVQVKYQGKVYETQPIEIQVTEGAAPARRPPPKLEGGITL